MEETPLGSAILTYISYGLMVLFGYLRDFMRSVGLDKAVGKLDAPRTMVSS